MSKLPDALSSLLSPVSEHVLEGVVPGLQKGLLVGKLVGLVYQYFNDYNNYSAEPVDDIGHPAGRERSASIPDPSSSSFGNDLDDDGESDDDGKSDNDGKSDDAGESDDSYINNRQNEHKYRERQVDKHILHRFIRYIRLAGITQRISEETNVGRGEVVTGGRSLFQDHPSHRGRSIHAAHLVRVGDINPMIPRDSDQYIELKNFLGHTQNVPNWANMYHGIGGRIDRFQSNQANLDLLATINFKEDLTEKNRQILTDLKERFLLMLCEEISKGTLRELKPEVEMALKKAIRYINEASIELLFQKGRNGYNGEYKKKYLKK